MGALGAQTDWFLDDLRVVRGASDHTISNYARDIARFAAFLEASGVSFWGQVDAATVERYVTSLAEGVGDESPLSASSISRHLSSIRSFYRWMAEQNLVAGNPAAGVSAPKAALQLPKALPLSTVEAILEGARLGPPVQALRDSALVELLYGTGARVSEAVGLSVDDVALDAEFPVVRLLGKGERERMVPVGSYAALALEAYLSRSRPALAAKGTGSAFLFLNLRGAPLSRQSAWEIIQRSAKSGGVAESVSPHTLRHSFATHLLEGGASIREVQELLGHASVTTTQIYTRLTAQSLQEMYRASHPRAL